ncbi:MAG: response regulator [Deltaproteobacteria bacterium]|nr:response regulator [Deltaproteobacteria bacterium]
MTTHARKILVLDDDELQLDLVRRYFALSGFDVHASGGRASLVDELATLQPGVVLLDVNVPGAGKAALPDLVATVRRTGLDVAVYLFSAEDESTLRRLTATCGADGYFAKGTSLESIAAGLEALARKRATTSSARLRAAEEAK